MALAAVVTGATSGVGRAIALDLLARGVRTVVVGRREHLLATLVDEHPDAALPLAADAADPATARAALELLAPRPDHDLLLVNAAGETGPIGPVGSVDLDWWASSTATNLLAPVYFTETFVPAMMAARSGRIINVSSAQAFHPPTAIVAAYATHKVALNFYTGCVAEQLEGTEVAAVAIHPGDVRTEIWDSIGSQADAMGEAGESLRAVVARIMEGGGDPLDKAVELVWRLVESPAAEINGTFAWIEGGIQKPLPTDF